MIYTVSISVKLLVTLPLNNYSETRSWSLLLPNNQDIRLPRLTEHSMTIYNNKLFLYGGYGSTYAPHLYSFDIGNAHVCYL
jgi:hypothetical protein